MEQILLKLTVFAVLFYNIQTINVLQLSCVQINTSWKIYIWTSQDDDTSIYHVIYFNHAYQYINKTACGQKPFGVHSLLVSKKENRE